MSNTKKLSIEVKCDDGSKVYVNPMHIIKVTQTPSFEFIVQLTNGDIFKVSYGEASKIREYFESI